MVGHWEVQSACDSPLQGFLGVSRYLPLSFGSLAPHMMPSFIVFDIVSGKGKLDKSQDGGRLPSKISAALSSLRLGTCCDHSLFAAWLVPSQLSDRAGGKIWKI